MRALLDTHVFLGWESDPTKLSPKALAVLLDPANTVLLSVVSAWEVVIKSQTGKITLANPLPTIVAQQQANGVQVIPINLNHALAVALLPTIHKDPFDRLLVALAIIEKATLITADPLVAQ